MKSFALFAGLLLAASVYSASAQDVVRCGTDNYVKRLKQEDPSLESRMARNEVLLQQALSVAASQRTTSTTVTIPVVFHVLYNNPSQNISQNRILDQLATLNADYGRYNIDTNNTPAAFRSVAANTNIQFCLAQQDPNGNWTSGIIRVPVSVNGFDPIANDNMKFTAQGGHDAWPASRYLNVWIGNFTGSSTSIIGISQQPGMNPATDGCCVLYSSVGGRTYPGTFTQYPYGRTLTHEVGHWLYLYHVWGDDGSSCLGTDNVADTPNQSSENYGCPTFPHVDACSPNSPGVMFMNYMDYSDDACLNMFTAGQGARMNAALNSAALRLPIKSSNGCSAPVGIRNPSVSAELLVYPNPASGILFLRGAALSGREVSLHMDNLLGQRLIDRQLAGNTDPALNLDISSLVNGVYTLTVVRDGESVTRRIVVTR